MDIFLSYRDFVNKITKKCPHDVGDVFTTVNDTDPEARWPGTSWQRLTDVYLVARDPDGLETSVTGSTIHAGLPNIEGSWLTTWNSAVRGFHNLTTSGAFVRHTDTSRPGRITAEDSNANNSANNGYPWFDASQFNPIYGNSTTVRPESFVVNMWLRTG